MRKTNAIRILEQNGVPFSVSQYEVDEQDLGAENVARKIHQPLEQVFKTLVLEGEKTGCIIAVIPGALEVDLKKLAKISGNKKCWMIPMKDIKGLTGYIRGGVSPVGMKKRFPVFLDQHAFEQEKIFVSAGERGMQVQLSAGQLKDITAALSGDISKLIKTDDNE